LLGISPAKFRGPSSAFQAHLRDSVASVTSSLKLVNENGKAGVRFDVPQQTVKLHLEPGPTEFLLKSLNMTLACQGLNPVKPILVVATPFIPELRGDIDSWIMHTIKTRAAFDVASSTC
jgi:hypothetical protein